MYKDEMIQMHQFLVYVLKNLAENDEFVLASTISNVMLHKDENAIPPNVTNALQELIKRSEKDMANAESK